MKPLLMINTTFLSLRLTYAFIFCAGLVTSGVATGYLAIHTFPWAVFTTALHAGTATLPSDASLRQ